MGPDVLLVPTTLRAVTTGHSAGSRQAQSHLPTIYLAGGLHTGPQRCPRSSHGDMCRFPAWPSGLASG